MANKRFEVDGAGHQVTGVVSPDGDAVFDVPVWTRELVLRIPDVGLTIPLRIGDLDPSDESSGQMQRLRNLGYLPLRGDASPKLLLRAVEAFQRALQLPVDGVLNAATKAALRDQHRS